MSVRLIKLSLRMKIFFSIFSLSTIGLASEILLGYPVQPFKSFSGQMTYFGTLYGILLTN